MMNLQAIRDRLTRSITLKTILLFAMLLGLMATLFSSNYFLTKKTLNIMNLGSQKTFPTLLKLDASLRSLEDYQLKMGDGIGQQEEDYIDQAEEIGEDISKTFGEIAKLDPSRAEEVQTIRTKFDKFQEGSVNWAKNLLEKNLKLNPDDPQTKDYFTKVNELKDLFKNLRDSVYAQYLADLKKSEENATLTINVGIFILAFSTICSIAALLYTRRYVISPIRQMAKSSLRVIGGSFDTAPNVDLSDEVGQLNNNFNSMVLHLKEMTEDLAKSNASLEAKQKEILALNASLEQKVAEQTRDIRTMLEYTKIGLLSVTQDLLIHKDYARYLETIVEEKQVAGKNIQDLLINKSRLGPDNVAKLMTALEYSIGEDDMFFEANEMCFPREFEAEFNGKIKHLDADWSPVVDKHGKVEKILVSLRDITETLRLRKEAEEGRRSVKLLGEVLDMGPDKFTKLMSQCQEAWTSLDKIMEGKSDFSEQDIRASYVWLHTMKGNARMYRLSELTDAIHQAEELVTNTKALSPEDYHHYQQAVVKAKHSTEAYQKAFEPILKLKSQLLHSAETQGGSDGQESFGKVLKEMGDLGDRLALEIGKAGCYLVLDLPPEIEPPASFVSALSKGLIHLVRNSVDHGLESVDERLQAGKPPKGTIKVFIDEEGRLAYCDDGRGLNLKKIREKALRIGKSPNTQEEIADMIFDPGFSTQDQTTDISGRGVGMDAVRSFLNAVGSDIKIIPQGTRGDYLKFYFAIDLPEETKIAYKKAS